MPTVSKLNVAALALWALVLWVSGCGPAPEPQTDSTQPVAQTIPAENALDFREVVNSAKDKVFPAVVYIRCLKEEYESGKKQQVESTGSGVIMSATGLTLTNWHVVDKAVSVRCLLSDGSHYDAKVIGSDKDSDLALLKLTLTDNASALPFADIGDSNKLREGDFVMTMGAPLGLSRSVSIGIISCTRRYLPGISEYSLWLQTDAAINPGNSGGPLVNTDGMIVGINTRGALMYDNLGFSIPTDTIKHVVDQLKKYGEVKRAWTGLQLQPLRDFDKNIYFNYSEGVIVSSIEPGSPAETAGIKQKDRIVAINDKPLNAVNADDLPDVQSFIAKLPDDQTVKVSLFREDEALTVELTPREKGKVQGDELDCPRWDFTAKTINQFEKKELYYYKQKGVYVLSVKRGRNAANAGFWSDDVILSIDGKPVETLDDVKAIHAEAVKNVNEKYRLMFVVLRNGLTRQIVLNFQKDYEKQ